MDSFLEFFQPLDLVIKHSIAAASLALFIVYLRDRIFSKKECLHVNNGQRLEKDVFNSCPWCGKILYSEDFMSGGYFDYNQYHIEEIISDIENVIYENGNPKDGYKFTKQTIDKLEEAIIVLRKAVIMVQGIDWLLEGDDDEETFHSRWEEDLGY